MSIQYLLLEHMIAIHDTLIGEFGGSFGLRDLHLLESAIAQPTHSFGGQDLYPTLYEKAAAYAFSISENQPFIDGNKRTAASTASVFLELNGLEITCAEGQIYELMMNLANKRLSREGLNNWFRQNTRKIRGKKTKAPTKSRRLRRA